MNYINAYITGWFDFHVYYRTKRKYPNVYTAFWYHFTEIWRNVWLDVIMFCKIYWIIALLYVNKSVIYGSYSVNMINFERNLGIIKYELHPAIQKIWTDLLTTFRFSYCIYLRVVSNWQIYFTLNSWTTSWLRPCISDYRGEERRMIFWMLFLVFEYYTWNSERKIQIPWNFGFFPTKDGFWWI